MKYEYRNKCYFGCVSSDEILTLDCFMYRLTFVTSSVHLFFLLSRFLSAHEADRLRDEVEKVRETYEGTAAYSRRFRDAADLAYPIAQRNADQHRIMKTAYLRGLRD